MRIIHVLFCISLFSDVAAQNKPGQISYTKTFWGYKFYQDGNQYSRADLVDLVQKNEDAYTLMRQARTNATLGSIIGSIGGGLIGWPIVKAIVGEQVDWTILGLGLVATGIGIPMSQSADRK